LAEAKKVGASLSDREAQELCSRGWTVVAIDYRLVPAAFLKDIVEDVRDAYNWVRNDLSKIQPIDPELITVFGGSAGAGLALMTGYMLTPRPKAIIAFYPYCTSFIDGFAENTKHKPSKKILDLIKTLKQEQPILTQFYLMSDHPRIDLFDAVLLERKGGWMFVSDDPNEAPESIIGKLKEFSARENIDQTFPPTYLNHGLDDFRVPYDQSVKMAEKLKEKNIPYVLDLIPGEIHAFDLKDPSEKVWKDNILPAFDFAAKFMIKSNNY